MTIGTVEQIVPPSTLEDPLRSLTDTEINSKHWAASRAARRGEHILGPFSLQALDVEVSRRASMGQWKPGPVVLEPAEPSPPDAEQ